MRTRSHRGTSLVEVLVAMVILLFGIFGLVRLFPAGFTTIIYGRNVSQAQALLRGMSEAARARFANLPEAVEAFNPLTLTTFPSLPIKDELTPYQPNANQAPDTRFSDLNKIRRVLGETTRIPAPVMNSPYMPLVGGGQRAAVSPYTLTFSPIYSAVLDRRTGLGGIFAYAGNSLNRVVFSGPPAAPDVAALDTASYGIDYGGEMLYFKPVNYPRTFKLDYSFTVPEGATSYVTGQNRPDTEIVIAANAQQYDLKPALPSGARLEPQQEQVYRSFIQLAPNQPFSNDDPYQFKVLNPVLGIIGFNPLAATLGAGGPSSSPITARVDYDVDDWHIIQEQRVVPAAAPFNVKLTLSGIEQAGNVDEYQEIYDRLIKDYPGQRPSPVAPGVDLVVMDEETGLTIDSLTLQDPTNPGAYAGTGANGIINYQNGAISFNPLVQWTLPNGSQSATEPIAGKRIRIYYRTRQNWGLQLTKAATTYYREPNIQNLGYREYNVGSLGYLFFPIQDHDQAVLIDYTWVQREPGGPDIVRTETGEYHQILDPALATSPQSLFGSAAMNPNWWTQVDGAQRGDYLAGSVNILRVRGVSVRARAIWREGARWRKLDLDSFVGRDRGT